MVICHITLTSDEISFQGVLLSLYLHKSYLEGPSHWKGTLDVFYARTACHSALASIQNLTGNQTLFFEAEVGRRNWLGKKKRLIAGYSKSQSNHREFHRC